MAFKGKLYPYQSPIVKHFARRGSLLLAFAPGTGKTPTSIACAEHLMDEDEINLCLIICPSALKYQWQERLLQFGNARISTIDGDKKFRDKLYQEILTTPTYTDSYRNKLYVIVSYDYVLLDEQLSYLNPDMVILDEASAIKSFKTQRSKKIKKIFKDVPYRMALTATPIENRPDELFSIMQWVDSTVLGRYDLFDKAYITRHKNGWATSYRNLDVLHERMGDAMVRKARTDPDVKPFLPDVDTSNWVVPLAPKVAHVYSLIAEDMLTELSKIDTFFEINVNKYAQGEDESTPPGRLMAMHMCLEMLLCHPRLIQWSSNMYDSDKEGGSEYANLLYLSGDITNVLDYSPKLDLLKGKLQPILDDPVSKVLIYSKYKEMLNILKKELPYKSVLFTGDMNAKEKDAARKLFDTDPGIRLFLSSYAGGYGLDMRMASHLINFDLPWSFGEQDQINSRHVRASSDFDTVYVRNLIVASSIEERKMRMLERKRRIAELAIDGVDPGDDPFGASVALDADFLREHLHKFIGA